jgi:IS5 family transposase
VITTPANVNDTVPADELIRGDERVVWGDGAYHTHRRQAALKACGHKPRLAWRPNKHHPELPPRLKLYNRLIARLRAAVETTFATWKRRMDSWRSATWASPRPRPRSPWSPSPSICVAA